MVDCIILIVTLVLMAGAAMCLEGVVVDNED